MLYLLKIYILVVALDITLELINCSYILNNKNKGGNSFMKFMFLGIGECTIN